MMIKLRPEHVFSPFDAFRLEVYKCGVKIQKGASGGPFVVCQI